jgi:hypothetical protein
MLKTKEETRSMFNRQFGKLAVAAAVLLAPGALHAETPFTPAKGGYSVTFPGKPQEKEVSLSPQVKSTVYSVNRDDAAFLAGYTEYTQDMDVDKELAADVQSFVTSLPARMTERKRSAVKLANGTSVERVEFSFDGDKTAGRGVAIMTGPRSSVMIAGLSMKPAGKPADVDEFVKSFKLAGQE